jgi:hypothetical protein
MRIEATIQKKTATSQIKDKKMIKAAYAFITFYIFPKAYQMVANRTIRHLNKIPFAILFLCTTILDEGLTICCWCHAISLIEMPLKRTLSIITA